MQCLKSRSHVPHYITTLLSNYSPPRFLRSTLDITRLNVPRANKVLGQKAFSVAWPIIWNNLPTAIRESTTLSAFRKRLTFVQVNFFLVRYDLDGIAPYKL